MTYIDLNMVRAGVVNHPSDWGFSGYDEIQNPCQRYRIIDYESVIKLFQFSDLDHMKASLHQWVVEAIKHDPLKRQNQWTQSIAVGDKPFLDSVKETLKHKARGRTVAEAETGDLQLREIQEPYGEKSSMPGSLNAYPWE